MSKLKTKKGALKRFKVTKGGVKHRSAFRNHILRKRNTKAKRQLRGPETILKSCDEKLVLRMLRIL